LFDRKIKYVGSKARILKHILPTIQQYADAASAYVEPFVGGANVICKVKHNRKWENDNHPNLILLLRSIANGWIPPTVVTEEDYKRTKEKYNNGESGPLIGFTGFCCSYSGKWWGGYARGEGRNYAEEASKHLVKQAPSLKDIFFSCTDYKQMTIPSGSLIYCDPPYENTTKYSTGKFNHKEFWDWCRIMGNHGNTILVSEYSAPIDFDFILEVPGLCSSLTKQTGSKKATEKLFLYKGTA
jgi:DNA adenine methylase